MEKRRKANGAGQEYLWFGGEWRAVGGTHRMRSCAVFSIGSCVRCKFVWEKERRVERGGGRWGADFSRGRPAPSPRPPLDSNQPAHAW